MIFVLTHYVSVFVIMSKIVTIVLDDELVKKLKIIQSKKITKSKKSVSFSGTVNDELRKALK
jgi:predicted transcriptional regulator